MRSLLLRTPPAAGRSSAQTPRKAVCVDANPSCKNAIAAVGDVRDAALLASCERRTAPKHATWRVGSKPSSTCAFGAAAAGPLPHSKLQTHVKRAPHRNARKHCRNRRTLAVAEQPRMYKTSSWRTEPARVLFTTIALPRAKHPLGSFACSHAEAALAVPTPPGSPCPTGCRIVVAGSLVVTGLRPALAPGRWPHHDGLHNPRRLFRCRHSLRLPAEAPNGSRLPCRAGRGMAPRPVWTCAQNTAPTLAGLLLEPHSQSEGLAACEQQGGNHPRFLRTFPD